MGGLAAAAFVAVFPIAFIFACALGFALTLWRTASSWIVVGAYISVTALILWFWSSLAADESIRKLGVSLLIASPGAVLGMIFGAVVAMVFKSAAKRR